MLRNLDDINNAAISATDGQIGHVKDFYFDDDAWAVRYFVVETGSWLNTRRVLVSPIAVMPPNWQDRSLPVKLTMEQVRNSPSIDTDKPVSRQHESQVLGYYGYPMYWGGAGLWGEGLYPDAMDPGFAGHGVTWEQREREMQAWLRAERDRHRNDNPRLRSCEAVTGHHIHAMDGDIGHLAGFLVDDQTWAIRYLVVDTSNWWLGHKVLVAPHWIQGVHWVDQTVSVDLTREAIQTAPAYDPDRDWTAAQDLALHQHYGRSGDWADGGGDGSADSTARNTSESKVECKLENKVDSSLIETGR